MPSLDRTTDFAPASLVILQAEQPFDVRLVAFFRPPHREEVRCYTQSLLQRLGSLAQLTLQIADEIQPPIDERLLGIVFAFRLHSVPFSFRTFPEGIELRFPGAVGDP